MKRGTLIEYNGEAHTLTEWSKIVGISYGKLRERYLKGYEGERLLEKARTLNCKVCGKEFVTEISTRKCCSVECSKENAKENARLYNEQLKAIRAVKPKKKEKKFTVTEMALKLRNWV